MFGITKTRMAEVGASIASTVVAAPRAAKVAAVAAVIAGTARFCTVQTARRITGASLIVGVSALSAARFGGVQHAATVAKVAAAAGAVVYAGGVIRKAGEMIARATGCSALSRRCGT